MAAVPDPPSRWQFRRELYPGENVGGDRRHFNALIYLKNIKWPEPGEGRGQIWEELEGIVFDGMRQIGVDFPDQQNTIELHGNNEAGSLIADYDYVINLARQMAVGFAVDNYDNTPIANLPEYPADVNWLLEKFVRVFGPDAIVREGLKWFVEVLMQMAQTSAVIRYRYLAGYMKANWRFAQLRSITMDRRINYGNRLVHSPDLVTDCSIAKQSIAPFTNHLLRNLADAEAESFRIPFRTYFVHFYRMTVGDALLLRDYAVAPADTPEDHNIANIFSWLIDYINRYQKWRTAALDAVRTIVQTMWTDTRTIARQERRKWHRRLGYPQAAYENFFLRCLRRLITQRAQLGRIRLRTWGTMRYCITGLNALVRASKINRQTNLYPFRVVLQDYEFIGNPRSFPNFDQHPMGPELPVLHERARPPNDLEEYIRSPGTPGGSGGLGGRNGPGGLYGLAGARGRGGVNATSFNNQYYQEDSDHGDTLQGGTDADVPPLPDEPPRAGEEEDSDAYDRPPPVNRRFHHRTPGNISMRPLILRPPLSMGGAGDGGGGRGGDRSRDVGGDGETGRTGGAGGTIGTIGDGRGDAGGDGETGRAGGTGGAGGGNSLENRELAFPLDKLKGIPSKAEGNANISTLISSYKSHSIMDKPEDTKDERPPTENHPEAFADDAPDNGPEFASNSSRKRPRRAPSEPDFTSPHTKKKRRITKEPADSESGDDEPGDDGIEYLLFSFPSFFPTGE
ncbi:hypothetical protein F5Y05DRAFT_419561 [Hypoxylon sp. FL0543]|nr:hypothetical protein F5Y05DRAFT_419561 [Hypoxylon sp. FL0543]